MTIKKLTPQQLLQSMDDKYKFIAKDKDGSAAVFTDKPHIEENKFSTPREWVGDEGYYVTLPLCVTIDWQSYDWTQCCVEREEVAEPNNDGWIEHNGSPFCPVLIEDNAYFSVTLKSGQCIILKGEFISWQDVVAYKYTDSLTPYQPPKPDYSKWVGCLCKFWDDSQEVLLYSTIKKVETGVSYPFYSENGASWKHCRPVRPDEIKFVED